MKTWCLHDIADQTKHLFVVVFVKQFQGAILKFNLRKIKFPESNWGGI